MPTIKQKKAFKEITENHRSVSAAMREVGYDESTATKPSNLTDSKGWAELMETYLPDDELAKKHKQFLNSDREEIGIKALDLSYKLKGSYAPDKNININMSVKSIDPTNPKVLKLIEELRNANEQRETD